MIGSDCNLIKSIQSSGEELISSKYQVFLSKNMGYLFIYAVILWCPSLVLCFFWYRSCIQWSRSDLMAAWVLVRCLGEKWCACTEESNIQVGWMEASRKTEVFNLLKYLEAEVIHWDREHWKNPVSWRIFQILLSMWCV